jgi:hypothetical protein
VWTCTRAALADWLLNIGASATRGRILLQMPQHSVDAPVAPGTAILLTTPAPTPSVQVLNFRTPIEAPAAAQCGRVDFGDYHVGAGAGRSQPTVPFPTG